MLTGQALDAMPIGVLYILTVLAMLATVEVGYRLTRPRRSPWPPVRTEER